MLVYEFYFKLLGVCGVVCFEDCVYFFVYVVLVMCSVVVDYVCNWFVCKCGGDFKCVVEIFENSSSGVCLDEDLLVLDVVLVCL